VVFRAPPNFPRTAAANDGVVVEPGKVATADLVVVDGRRLWGRVVDADSGQPMPGRQVGYYGPAAPRGGANLGTTTDSKGEFSFRVPAGPSYVYIMDGWGRGAEANVTVPENQDLGPAVLRASARDRYQRDLAIEPFKRIVRPFGPPMVMDSSGSVSGVVVDSAGKPIGGARIFSPGDPPDKFVTSDKNGSFVLSRMPEGSTFGLFACKQGYHAWVGTPRTGDVLRIVLEPKVTTSTAAAK
jgi:hypothetical protein